MPNITREERERRRLAAEAAAMDASIEAASKATLKAQNAEIDDRYIAAADVVMTGTEVRTRYDAITSGKSESKHWPGLFFDPSDPEPDQNPILGTQTPEWQAWFQRQGGAK